MRRFYETKNGLLFKEWMFFKKQAWWNFIETFSLQNPERFF